MVPWVLLTILLVCATVYSITAKEMPNIKQCNGGKQLTLENINQNIARIECSVQGPVCRRASQLKKQIKQGVKKPFTNILQTVEGETAPCCQKPITFIRQVTALSCLPELLNDTFPCDVKARVMNLLQNCQGNSIGALTETAGLKIVRQHIAAFIERRDNHPADWQDIIIVPGVSAAVKILFKLLNYTSVGQPTGVMVPVPQFPLFTRTITDYGLEKICYYLDEENDWSLKVNELHRALVEGSTVCFPRAIVVVNPGNPTAQVLPKDNIQDVVRFANEEKLLIIAVEVYQDNVYEGHLFHSFKKVICDMGAPYNLTELVSLMSCSKGYSGETGLRGGYMELFNIDPTIKEDLKESIMICDSPPMCAQIALDCIADPPTAGDPSYHQFHLEKTSLLRSVSAKAKIIYEFINNIPGLSCSPIQGAFFVFVKVEIPEKAVKVAKLQKLCPSTFYVLEMLEKCGVVTVPGEGFGQKPHSYHFRMTILLSEDKLKEVLRRIKEFHNKFIQEYQ